VKLAKAEVKTRDGMALKSHAQLKALYADLHPNKETIVYCQSSGRACITASVLRSPGFDKVRVFEESWLGYGNNLSLLAEAVPFVNIESPNRKIKSLESDVENLTAEVKARKKASQTPASIQADFLKYAKPVIPADCWIPKCSVS